MSIAPEQIFRLLAGQTFATVATQGPRGPQAAVVGIVAEAGEVFFDTLGSSRKAENLRQDGRAAVVVWQDAWTIQLEGVADEPKGAELEAWLARYLARFPDGKERQAWPGITYFRIRWTWIRHSDFAGGAPELTEIDGSVQPPPDRA